ncbi:sugar ABC transporter permease [Listeria booriae]|uniref:Sugar ABC transporter permease n=1 Tax=Listeria booriae TaxID=1552123 RepID=A0A7X0TKP2_9LIST|nr:sugar ABC transporter permease [Listeria booriae]MBC1246395.1 sugar ABC transporter permease [Listeria booriae]MBC1306393.1 sugar ABC transporter permease [Listeria booriae]MBC1330637.1 sugar ABC transporter permease [Listeria booriae]MBC2385947.1 sugar ABC transporter permease [Listeria booriae]
MAFLKRRNRDNVGYLFILPWIVGFLIFTAFPIIYSIYLSFFKVTITTRGIQTVFVKFQNFQQAFTGDIDFLNKVWTFTKEIFIAVPLIVILALIIAILLNQDIKFRGFFRTIFFLPVIIASGPVLTKLMGQGITSIPAVKESFIYQMALDNSDFFLAPVLIYILDNTIVLLWFSGVQILIFIAALQKMDPQAYEAAKIDGASTWEIFWKITLPSLYPMIFVNIIYTTVMYSVSTLNPVIDHIKVNMFKLQSGFGYSSALSWIYFVIISLILLIMAAVVMFFNRKK